MREIGDSSHPLADITNTTNQVILDRNERKKQRDKERYASLSREQKDELNRKACERRAEKKKRDQENKHEEGATRCVDENGATRCVDENGATHCVDENVSDGTNEQGTKQGINIHAADNVNEHTFLRIANSTDGDHGFDYYQNERGHGVNYYQNERGHGVNYYKNKHPFSPIYCCQEEKDKGQQCTDIQDGDEQFNFTHIRIDDNDGGADDPITAELQGGKIKCSIIFCMGWCFNSAWFVSILSFRMLLRYGAISYQPFGA